MEFIGENLPGIAVTLLALVTYTKVWYLTARVKALEEKS
jgi:hypothetical protein|tara:strand:+ start:313 stop:429 length:117 start_codon:yes stop_codon:yes gene_type:complete